MINNNQYIFHNIWDVIIPTDEPIFFRGLAKNHQPEMTVEILEIVQKHGLFCQVRESSQSTE